MIDWSDVGILSGVLVTLNGSLVWAVRWLLSRNKELLTEELKGIRKALADRDERRNHIEQEISILRECLPRDYVRREDWILSFSRIEQKIDAIWQYIHTRGD